MKVLSFPWKKKTPKTSVAQALRKFLPREQLKHLVEHCPDRREVIGFVAETLGMEEDDLLESLSEETGVPTASRIAPMDLEALPADLSIEQFRRTGSIAITQKGFLSGIVCVDPAVASRLLPKAVASNVYLGRWTAIREALDESERLHREKGEKIAQAERERMEQAALKVLELIVKQVSQFEVEEARIVFSDEGARYRFVTNDHRDASGEIHPGVQETLRCLLDKQRTPQGIKLQIACVSPSKLYELSWGSTRIESQEKDAQIKDSDSLPISPNKKLAEGKNEAVTPLHLVQDCPPVVLVVDDNEVFRCVLERFFERQGMRTIHASNGEEALMLLQEETPDVVVCDVHMPSMNGHEFIKAFRAQDQFTATPLIMLTSDDDVETELSTVEAGADAFLQKNEDPRKLCAYVSRFLKRELKAA
ncbi:MAG: response regulator [Bdellovibrionales bacterium]|nr:response regulator [Bdellovibrionales bacterium]